MGKLLEIVLTPVDVIVETELQVMSEPPKADVLLLRRRGRRWTEAQRQLLPNGVRDRNAHHHLLECKFSESVNEAALQQALSYDYFYRRTQQIKASELQTYLISARTPRTVLLTRFNYRQAEQRVPAAVCAPAGSAPTDHRRGCATADYRLAGSVLVAALWSTAYLSIGGNSDET